ncbi:HAD family hydrolase [Bifidobacterium sp. 82T10]|uniref:HAD family hydrolase n=1 Tax=Bifidobacterium miconis TaxID=2834435 RepID=A0ABS6WHE8_9BIFI|nr:HAD family hydrolase [Bifidobacterium miconis]MBW3093480.1 HAD family hydrolase [Bifidobacterium miconis]
MSRKLILLDIDGTLVGRTHRIPADAVLAVHAAQANGHLVMICTGRARPEIEDHILTPGFDGVISSAGACVEVGGKVLSETFMDPEVVTRVTRIFERLGVDYVWQSSKGMWATSGYLTRVNMRERFAKPSRESTLEYWHGIDRMRDRAVALGKPIGELVPASKGTFMVPPWSNLGVDDVREAIGDYLTVINGSMGMFAKVNGEVMIPGITKGSALHGVAETLGVSETDTIAVGDSDNDLPMLMVAGVAVAMGNGTDSVKEVADFVTGDVDQGGLLDAFTRLGLI